MRAKVKGLTACKTNYIASRLHYNLTYRELAFQNASNSSRRSKKSYHAYADDLEFHDVLVTSASVSACILSHVYSRRKAVGLYITAEVGCFTYSQFSHCCGALVDMSIFVVGDLSLKLSIYFKVIIQYIYTYLTNDRIL